MKKYLVIAGLYILLSPDVKAQSNSCSCFLLKEKNKILDVEKIVIENNKVEVLNDPAIIGPIFSLGEGMNGDMVQKERRGGMIIAQCKDNLLKLKIKSKEGVEKPLPDMNVAELKQMNIRLNVVGGDGTKKAFLIDHYQSIKEDKGPVIDMFGGKLPVKPGDYIITTETKKITGASALNGRSPFKIKNGWIVVPVTMSDGMQADFVVDLAATSTVIDKAILPNSTQINKIEMVEYSANGANTKNATMQGATGSVQEGLFLGKALLGNIQLGDMHIDDVNAGVLKTFPEKLQKAGIAGILGTDVLMWAGIVTISSLNEGIGVLEFGEKNTEKEKVITIPFTIAGGLLFVDGSVSNTALKFVLDTGARETILSKSFADDNGIKFEVLSKNKTITGIDGMPAKATVVKVPSFKIGPHVFTFKSMILGDVAALQSFGLHKGSAILGMDFFRQFSVVQIDFINKELAILN